MVFTMAKLTTVLLVVAFFQASVKCFPVSEKNETDASVVIVNEQKDVQKTSSSDLIAPDAESPDTLSPENMLSDAAIASLLQLLEKTLLMSLASQPEVFGGMNRMSSPFNNGSPSNSGALFNSGSPFGSGAFFNSGEMKETIIGPGTKLRVFQKTYNPPGITVVATGNIDGKNINKVTQNQMYASQNLKVLQSDSTKSRKEEGPLPDIVDVVGSDDVPKDLLNDLQVLETIRNEIEKMNSVF